MFFPSTDSLHRGAGRAPIAASVLPRIFDAFVQEARAERSGLGIGLHVVRRLVELHGGAVIAQSAGHGQGSTFTVTPPVAR